MHVLTLPVNGEFLSAYPPRLQLTVIIRLKTTLNLPKIEPRPPCPPRIFSKLYSYVDKTLVSASTSRKRARQNERQTGPERETLPERHTPSKDKSFEGFRTNRTPRPGLKYAGMKNVLLPRWVGPAIRTVCKEMDTGNAVPHVFAGVETLLFLLPPQAGEQKLEGKIAALIAAVWFYVTVKMEAAPTDDQAFRQRRKRVFGILKGLKGDEAVNAKVGEGEEAWEGWDVVTVKDVDAWLLEITEKGWLRMEWYGNVEDGGGVSGDVPDEEEDHDEEDEQIKRVQKRKKEWGKNVGRGSMKQDEFDYLSEEKKHAHAVWKEAMLAIIDKQIASGILHHDMDTTEG
jgi:origin recognition complex subunit 6